MTSENRAFNYAVLASIVLHALLLFGISQRDRARPAQPPVPILARLVEPPAPMPAAVAEPPQAEPLKPRPRARPKEQPPQRAEPAAEPAAEEPLVAQLDTVAPAPAAPPVTARADPVPPAPAASAAPAPPVQQGEAALDPRTVAEYRLQIIGAAPRYKRYPPVARENNWEGRVALRMVFSPSGRVVSLDVTRTSGYDVLDKQAAEMFRNAAAAVPVPPLLRGREFAVEVAAAYELTE